MVQAAVGESVATPGLFAGQLEVAATPMDTAEPIFNHPPRVLLTAWPQQKALGSLPGRQEKEPCNCGHWEVPGLGHLKLSPVCLLSKGAFSFLKGIMVPC